MNTYFREVSLFYLGTCSLFYISLHSKCSSHRVEAPIALVMALTVYT